MLANPTTRACAYMALSMAGFTINDTLVKTVSDTLNAGQIMVVRGAIIVAMLLLVLRMRRISVSPAQLKNKPFLIRVFGEAFATVLFLTAIAQLPLATVTAILQALPLVVTLGAALVFGERFGWRRLVAILVGFIGVLMVVKPGFEGFNSYSLLVLGTVVFAATRDLATRAVPAEINSLVITTATAACVCAVGVVMIVPTGGWAPINGHQLLTLTVASIFLFTGYQFIVLAMRQGDIATVAPFRYTSLIWAIALGFLVFGEIPDRWTLLGSAIVVATGIYALYREHKRTKHGPALGSITSPPPGRGT
ncbi:MAG: DMT family transporter [Ahrensia sp.]